jgi:hypothetical protein
VLAAPVPWVRSIPPAYLMQHATVKNAELAERARSARAARPSTASSACMDNTGRRRWGGGGRRQGGSGSGVGLGLGLGSGAGSGAGGSPRPRTAVERRTISAVEAARQQRVLTPHQPRSLLYETTHR